MKDLQHYAEMCEIMLDGIGIPYRKPISYKSKTTKSWGNCRRTCDGYYITVNNQLLDDDVPDKGLINTLLHELLHTIPNGMCHTGEWKKAADKVWDKLGYKIKRTNSAEEKGISVEITQRNYNYALKCEKCGQIFGYTRMSKAVQNPDRCRCKCGGKVIRIK